MKLISKVVYTNEGNSVANYTEYVYKCDRCNGEGYLSSVDYMDVINNGTTTCPDCDGMGTHTVRR